MGWNLHWSITAASEAQRLRGDGILEEVRSEHIRTRREIVEADSVSKTQAQGIADSILKSLPAALTVDGRPR